MLVVDEEQRFGVTHKEAIKALSTGIDALTLTADDLQDSRSPNLDVLMLGGQPINEPVVSYGPFVMNTRDEILTAIRDYQAGRMGIIPAVHLPHL